MRPLKVCHIITKLELGGAQRNTLYTVANLKKDVFEPILITGPGGILDDEAKAGGQTIFIEKLVRPVHPLFDAWALVELYRVLRRLKPEIVHTHSSKAGILGRIAAYLAGVPVIIHTFHGFGFTPGQSTLVRRLYIVLERFCGWLTHHAVFVSQSNLEEAESLRIAPQATKSLIRSGIALGERHLEERTEAIERHQELRTIREIYGIPPRVWLATYIGNFKPQKNPMDLVRVADAVHQKKPDIHFLFVGEGELREPVREWAIAHGLADHIHFPGWIRRRTDLEALLKESGCFLMTSLWEGLPRALVEAMATALPAVAYGVDGVRDIVEDGKNGFAVAPGAEAVAQAAEHVVWLAEHPSEARRMGLAAKTTIMQDRSGFNIDDMVRLQEKLYRDLYDRVPLKEAYGLPTL